MILDVEIFKEVVHAIGVETSLSVINMFEEQSQILISGAKNSSTPHKDRSDSLHALKGMSKQLGLTELSQLCATAYGSIQNNAGEEVLSQQLNQIETALDAAQQALMKERNLLLA